MSLLALDLATVTGWCVWDDGYVDSSVEHFRKSPKEPRGAIAARLAEWLADINEDYQLTAIVYEHPTPRGKGAMLQYGMALIVEKYAYLHDMEVGALYPSTVKKAVAGSGRASKEDVCAAVKGRLPQIVSLPDDNESDAIALAIAWTEKEAT